MRRRVVLSMIAALLAASPLHAQTGQITGSVSSADGGRPLPGATVSVLGSSLRVATGPDGRYTLRGVSAGPHQVNATVLGHGPLTQPVNVAAGQSVELNFVLQPASVSVQGVVAIGYGGTRLRDRTGSVQAVTPEQFNPGRVVSPEQLITAKVPGVQVVDSNEPGGGISIRIRGGTSVSSSNEPLFVVDNVPLPVGGGISAGRNPLNFLNPQDIESVTVLKDASATAIYGSRGANGVIIITTKQGTRGPAVEYTTDVSTSSADRLPSLLSASQFRAAVQQYAPENMGKLGNAATDWQDAVIRNAIGQEHSLGISGAGQAANYRLSLGYLDQQGIVRDSRTKRVTGSLNYNQRLFRDHLNLRGSILGARNTDQFTPGGVIGEATSMAPTQAITLPSGSYFEWTDPLGTNNPIQELSLISDQGTTYRSVGNIEAQYRLPFMEALTATVRAGYDLTSVTRTIFQPSTLQSQVESGTGGSLERRNPSATNTVLDAFAHYAKPITRWDSDIDVTAGYSFEQGRNEFPTFIAQGLSSDLLGPNGVPAAKVQQEFLSINENRLISGFARMNYSLKDRYLLTLSVRRDGSSRFSPNNQWGTFPAAAFAWRVSEEPFFAKANKLFPDLKLRASWGVNGNQSFGDYLYLSNYVIGTNLAQVQFGNDWVSTIRPSAYDPNLRWEQTTSWNLGADYGLGSRVTGTIDYYVKNTKDLIFTVPVAAGTNLSNYVTTNIGSMRNVGLELGLNARVLDGGRHGLSYEASFNAATNRNQLLTINPSAAGSQQILTGGISGAVGNNIQVLEPGFPVNSFLVYRQKYSNGKPVYSDNDADMYVDVNGDGVINQDDRVPFHSPQPRWILSHTSNFAWRKADLGFTLRSYLGNYVYNNVASNLGHYDALKGAAPANLQTSVLTTGFVKPQYFSDYYVENASFLRMDNITLGYTFQPRRGVQRVRVFGTVQNVFTITGYSGVDPTAGLNGIDNNIYPRSRTLTTGVNVGF